jgi:serine/threonine protein phosphatase PrpC
MNLPSPDHRSSSPAPRACRVTNIHSAGRTDPGRVRQTNQDNFVVCVLRKALQVLHGSLVQEEVYFSSPLGYFFLVADGVGGHSGGEQASALTVNALENFVLDTLNWCGELHTDEPGETDALLAEFQQALSQADSRLFREVRRHPELTGMGTTTTLGYLTEGQLYVAHVGDSRCYLLRRGMLYRITSDHTLVAEMVNQGLLKPEEVAQHAFRHVITNVVGGSDEGVRVEVHKLPLEPKDRLLFCSDGLTEMVGDEEIGEVLAAEADPDKACKRLVNRANEQGGKDNITVVIAHCE